MNDECAQDLVHALFCFKKATGAVSRFLAGSDGGGLSAIELAALGCIDRCDKANRGAADQTAHQSMHKTLSVSKAAVSRILGSLEKRGFIRREPDPDNRRKIIIRVTKKGKSATDKGQKRMDVLMSRIIERFGEKDARNFMGLLERFAEAAEEAV